MTKRRTRFLEQFVQHFDFLEGQWENKRDKWARSDEDAPLAPTQEEALIEIYKRASG